jgi:ribonuclease D
MQYTYVNNQQALDEFCHQASSAPAIAVDTEFVRTRTLYPKLGLIQIYDGKSLVLVDPLAIDDCSSLKALLTNQKVVKVLHSCSEDLETFWHAYGLVPSPVFDTQFAASLVGMGTSLGYAKLVETMLGEVLDKGESRTDWLARPLSSQQLEYAANDVWFLFDLYPALLEQVNAQNKLDWVYSEMALLATKKCTAALPEYAYLGFKNNWKLSGRSLYLLQMLAKWRLNRARTKDMALNFVVKEQNLWNIAKLQPQTKQALSNIQGMGHHEVRIHGDELLEIVNQAQQADPSQFPPRVERLTDYDAYKNTVASIKTICQNIADTEHIPIELVGSKKQVNQLIKWCWFDQDETRLHGLVPDLINGWRGAMFTEKLLSNQNLNLASAMTEEA